MRQSAAGRAPGRAQFSGGATADAIDREHDVDAQGDLLPIDRGDPVISRQPRVPRYRLFGDRLDRKAGRRQDVEESGEVAGEDALVPYRLERRRVK